MPCHVIIASCAWVLPNFDKIIKNMGFARGGGFMFSSRHVEGFFMNKLVLGLNLVR